jgi:hypothetical protein
MRSIDVLQQFYTYLITHGLYDLLTAIGLAILGYRLASFLPRLLRGMLTNARIDPILSLSTCERG